MILFDLLCSDDHRFEGWFKSGETFDAQIAAGEVTCPVCGDADVHKALSAPALLKGNSRSDGIAVKLREAMAELRQRVIDKCDYVGDQFPEEARSIHYGEKEERPIYGEATLDEARKLQDEGIEVVAIPWPSRQDS
jgi:hypothetical protein